MKRLFSKCVLFLFAFIMVIANTGSINAEAITGNIAKYGTGNTGRADINIFEPVFDDGGKPSAYPLIDYPSGSYYSTRKGGCTCHSWCNWDSNCDCIKFDNSIQCDGFAKYIYYVSHKHNHVTNEKLVYKNKTMNADYAKFLFKGTPTGHT